MKERKQSIKSNAGQEPKDSAKALPRKCQLCERRLAYRKGRPPKYCYVHKPSANRDGKRRWDRENRPMKRLYRLQTHGGTFEHLPPLKRKAIMKMIHSSPEAHSPEYWLAFFFTFYTKHTKSPIHWSDYAVFKVAFQNESHERGNEPSTQYVKGRRAPPDWAYVWKQRERAVKGKQAYAEDAL